jgi:hypothetical protein
MGRQVTVSVLPFYCRIRISRAIQSAFIFDSPFASIALFHDFTTDPAIERTPFGCHKRAFNAISYGCTNHDTHPLFSFLKPLIYTKTFEKNEFFKGREEGTPNKQNLINLLSAIVNVFLFLSTNNKSFFPPSPNDFPLYFN